MFCVKDNYYDFDESRNVHYHYALGKFKKSFFNSNFYFYEYSKGYESEHMIKNVVGWCYLPTEEEMEQIYGV